METNQPTLKQGYICHLLAKTNSVGQCGKMGTHALLEPRWGQMGCIVKFKTCRPLDSAIPLLGIYPKSIQRYTYKDVDGSIVCDRKHWKQP